MTTRAALDVATAFLDAFTAGDLDRTATYLADDFRFDGPIAHYRTAEEFLTGARPFVETLQPGWSPIATFGDDHHALLLYDLTLRSGAAMRIADHYSVADGKIRTESILWDTGRLRP